MSSPLLVQPLSGQISQLAVSGTSGLSTQVPTEGPPPSCVVDPLLPALLLDIKAQDAFISTETYQQVMGMEGSCPLSGHSLLTPS